MTDHFHTPENLQTRRRRARYRAEHRGTKELDLILGPFAAAHLEQFSAAQMDEFESLLDEEETDLQAVLVGVAPVPDGRFSGLIENIRAYQIRRVRGEPDLNNG